MGKEVTLKGRSAFDEHERAFTHQPFLDIGRDTFISSYIDTHVHTYTHTYIHTHSYVDTYMTTSSPTLRGVHFKCFASTSEFFAFLIFDILKNAHISLHENQRTSRSGSASTSKVNNK